MSWTANSRGKTETANVPLVNATHVQSVFTETVTLGAAKANRFSSVIDFIPVDKDGRHLPFTVISNTGSTNTSGSVSDQLYACYTRGGTYFQVKNTLRDCNYADDTNQGTSYRSIDATLRPRYVDTSYTGDFPYFKIRLLQAAVESTGKTIGLAIVVGAKESAQKNWRESKL